jgi:hypothetical protein
MLSSFTAKEDYRMTRARRTMAALAWTGLMSIVSATALADGKAPAMTSAGCQVQVTGSTSASWKGVWQKPVLGQPAKVGVGSDHWLTDDDFKQAFTAIAKMNGSHSPSVEEMMKKDPKLILLLLNCMDKDSGLSLGPNTASTYKDVPFAPKSYKIGTGARAPGQFGVVTLMVGKHPFRASEGTLDITKFDLEGIAGTFTFKANAIPKEPGKTIEVVGTFNFPCTGAGGRCKAK